VCVHVSHGGCRCSNVIDTKRHTLKSVYIEFIDGARQVLESEAERDFPILQEVRVHFSSFMTHLIKHCPGVCQLTAIL